MPINERLRVFRKKSKITQKELGEVLQVSQAAVAAYEKGTRSLSLELAEKITIRYNLSIDWLLTGKGEMFITEQNNDASVYKVECEKCDEQAQRVKELEQEVKSLKKSISELEQQNSELSQKLIQRLEHLLKLQEELVPQST
jgi:transcriptional regulator with XRE-family HTH domain